MDEQLFGRNKMLKDKRIFLLLVLILLSISSAMVPVASYPEGITHITLQVLKGIFMALSWVTFYYFLKKAFFDKYQEVFNRDIPRFVLMMARFLIFLFAVLSIIVFVFGKSILSFVALGGLVSAGLTFALGELILDAFSGVILESESPFDVGDWIRTHEGQEGRVAKISWRTVILEHINGYYIMVPHRQIAKGFTNLSKPDRAYWDIIEISLDYTIPIERAERIISAAVRSIPTLHKNKCLVLAEKVDAGGITYMIRYLIPDRIAAGGVRHDILVAVTEHLHEYGLKLSESLGEYALVTGEKPFHEESPLSIEKLIKKVDFFKDLPKSIVKNLSEKANRMVFGEGEAIVTEGSQGQSMFLIGEGLVEISISYQDKKGTKNETELFSMGYPEYFGEMALLLKEKRSATVTALTNTVVYEISQDLLKSVLKGNPKAFEKMKKQAIEKREENIHTKARLASMKVRKKSPAKGLLSNFKKFFK